MCRLTFPEVSYEVWLLLVIVLPSRRTLITKFHSLQWGKKMIEKQEQEDTQDGLGAVVLGSVFQTLGKVKNNKNKNHS